jgi:preprotein translocase subunit SecD
MKTILYSLISIFLFGIIAPSFVRKGNADQNILQKTVLIQAVDKNANSILLTESGKVISKRLSDYSSDKFEVIVIPQKNQIKVVLTDTLNFNQKQNLIFQKGKFGLFETYNRQSLSLILKDNQLFSQLTIPNAKESDAIIGCTSALEGKKVADYLNSLGFNPKCKFVWDKHHGDSDVCLYALKTEGQGRALIDGAQFESVKYSKDANQFTVDICLKKSVVELWTKTTTLNMNRSIAIVLDNELLAAPVVRSVIDSGHTSISGNFSESSVKYIAAMSNNGELSTDFIVVQ